MVKSEDILISNLIDVVNKTLDTSFLDKQIGTLTNELSGLNKEFEVM